MRRKQSFRLIKRDSQEEKEEVETISMQNNLQVIHTNAKSLSEDGPSSPRRRRISAIPRTKRDRKKHATAAAAERFRRREFSILIELIRTCLTTNDIRTYLPEGSNSIQKLSQLDVFEVAAKMIPDYVHDMISVRHILRDIEKLSNLSKRTNLRNMECIRPRVNYSELHYNIGLLTENAINKDKPIFAKYGKSGPSTTMVAESYRTQFQYNVQKDLELVFTTDPKEFFLVPDRIQSKLGKLHGARGRQNTDHFEHSNAEYTHFRGNLPLLNNDYENSCDCPEQTYEYLSTEKSLADQLASNLQCESKRPNFDRPEGTQDNEFHFSDSEFTLDPEDIINLEGNGMLDQPQTHYLPNEQTAGQNDSTGLSTGQFQHTKQMEYHNTENKEEMEKHSMSNRYSRMYKTAWALSNDSELPHTLRKRNPAQAFDENECVSGELSFETPANEDYTGKQHAIIEKSGNAMKYCHELDARYEDMSTKNDCSHIDECIKIQNEIDSPGCQSHRFVQEEEEVKCSGISEQCPGTDTRHISNKNLDLANSENDSAVLQKIDWNDIDIGAIEVFTTETANSTPFVGTPDELSSFVNHGTEPIDSDNNAYKFADIPIEACISNDDGSSPLHLFEIEISETEWKDIIESKTDDIDSFSLSDFDPDLFSN
ncbi:hypothetical protein ACTXT7_011406 [Hymenolepis weldensis]